MKKYLYLILIACFLGSAAYADNQQVILKFNTAAITNLGESTGLLQYGGKFDDTGFSFRNAFDIFSGDNLKISNGGGVTLLNDQISGTVGSHQYPLTNQACPPCITKPTKPLCNLDRDYSAGTYDVTFGIEPYYYDSASKKPLLLGYYVVAQSIKNN